MPPKNGIILPMKKNIFAKLSLIILFLFSIALSSCVPGNDLLTPGNGSANCRYGNCAPSYGYGRYGYDGGRYDYGHDRYGRDPYYDRGHWKKEDHRPHHSYQTPPRHYGTVPPPPPQIKQEEVIRPNCPAGTTFDGRHCIIPENQRRSGGKGTVNACPKGMWLSGDRCINH